MSGLLCRSIFGASRVIRRNMKTKTKEVSSRGEKLIASVDNSWATFLKMNANKYHPINNPKGIVNFCTAENNVCTPLLEERFKKPDLFIPEIEHLVRYPPGSGWFEAREAARKYFKEFMNADVKTDDLVLAASTRTGYDIVSYALFEEDDIILGSGPIYSGTVANCNERAQCVVEVVPTDVHNQRLEVDKYEAEYQRHTKNGRKVGGVVIVNPLNPSGVVFPPEEMIEICNWAAAKDLHVIVDEVFANCVYDPTARFKSYLSYRHLVTNPEKVAYLWSVSKDFGLPGLKFAVLHSHNESLRKAAIKLEFYHPCSPFAQDFAIKLLSDFDWLHHFHSEVNRRIKIHYDYIVENLQRIGIPVVPAQAGIFVLANFEKYMNGKSDEADLEFWQRIADGGLMLTPGIHHKCPENGWMRIVFACSKIELEEGTRRLYSLLKSPLQPVGSIEY